MVGKEETESPSYLGGEAGGGWGSLPFIKVCRLAVVTADKCPHLCEASLETVKGSINIKTDRKI